MIRVNLLPVKRRKKPTPVPPFVVGLVFILLFETIALGVTSYQMNRRIDRYEAQKRQNAARLKELDQKIREVRDYEANKKAFEEKIAIIERLEQTQNAPVRLLSELAANLSDGVWLDTLRESRWKVTLTGKGFTNADIVGFVDNLKASPYFTEVVLVKTERTKVGEVPVYRFTVRARLKV